MTKHLCQGLRLSQVDNPLRLQEFLLNKDQQLIDYPDFEFYPSGGNVNSGKPKVHSVISVLHKGIFAAFKNPLSRVQISPV